MVLTACGTDAPSPSPTPSPTSRPTPGAPSPSASADQAALYAAIERQVEAIRQLSPTRPVTPELLDEAGLRVELQRATEEDHPPAETARQERALKALGVLAVDADLAAIVDAFLNGQVAGFYRPRDGRLYVVSRSGAINAVERTTFAHEYTHALQDQNFALLQEIDGTRDGPENGDRDLARLALIEGDATLTMTYWAQEHLSPLDLLALLRSSFDPAQQAALDAMPPFLRDGALFPYQAGLQFAMRLQREGEWAAVDAAFGAPPESTEQILHPEKYAAGERPVPVTVPSNLAGALGAGWELTTEDTLGEFQISAWLAVIGSPAVTPTAVTPAAAAAGWGGDRMAFLEGPAGAWAMILRTTWDTEQDALQFATATSSALDASGRTGRVTEGASPLERWLILASAPDLVDRAERAATGP